MDGKLYRPSARGHTPHASMTASIRYGASRSHLNGTVPTCASSSRRLRAARHTEAAFPAALIGFSLLFDLATTVERSVSGVGAGQPARYTTVNLLILVAAWLSLCLGTSLLTPGGAADRAPSRHIRSYRQLEIAFPSIMVAALICVSLTNGRRESITFGHKLHVDVITLQRYSTLPPAQVENVLCPPNLCGYVVYAYAPYLEAHHLSVFQQVALATMTGNGSTNATLDRRSPPESGPRCLSILEADESGRSHSLCRRARRGRNLVCTCPATARSRRPRGGQDFGRRCF